MKVKMRNRRRDSLPIQESSKVLKKPKKRNRSVSPNNCKTNPLKVVVNRVKLPDESPSVGRPLMKTTPTKAQQKQFEPSLLRKFEKLQRMKIRDCRVLVKRQDLEELQTSLTVDVSSKKSAKHLKKNSKRTEEILIDEEKTTPKKTRRQLSAADDSTSVDNSSSSKKSKIKTAPSPIRKEVGEWPGVSPKKLSVTPTKFPKSQLIEQFGKHFFQSVVKMEHCPHPLMVAFEEEARKQRSKRKLSKNLSVSFQQEVEVFEQSAPSNKGNKGKFPKRNVISNLVDTPLPQRLQKIENGKVVIDTELDESFFLTNNLEAMQAATSTPLITKTTGKRGRKPLKGKKGSAVPSNVVPLIGINLLKNEDDDDDEEAEFIVPEVDIPEKHKIIPSTSSGISVASITKAVNLKEQVFEDLEESEQSKDKPLPKTPTKISGKSPAKASPKSATKLSSKSSPKTPTKTSTRTPSKTPTKAALKTITKASIKSPLKTPSKTSKSPSKTPTKSETARSTRCTSIDPSPIKDSKKSPGKKSSPRNKKLETSIISSLSNQNDTEEKEANVSEPKTDINEESTKEKTISNNKPEIKTDNKDSSELNDPEVNKEANVQENFKDEAENLSNNSIDALKISDISLNEEKELDNAKETSKDVKEQNECEESSKSLDNTEIEKTIEFPEATSNDIEDSSKKSEETNKAKELVEEIDNDEEIDNNEKIDNDEVVIKDGNNEKSEETKANSEEYDPPINLCEMSSSNDSFNSAIESQNIVENSVPKSNRLETVAVSEESSDCVESKEITKPGTKDSTVIPIDDEENSNPAKQLRLSEDSCVFYSPTSGEKQVSNLEDLPVESGEMETLSLDDNIDNSPNPVLNREIDDNNSQEEPTSSKLTPLSLDEASNDKMFDLSASFVEDLDTVGTNFSSDSTSETTNNVENIISQLTKDIEMGPPMSV